MSAGICGVVRSSGSERTSRTWSYSDCFFPLDQNSLEETAPPRGHLLEVQDLFCGLLQALVLMLLFRLYF